MGRDDAAILHRRYARIEIDLRRARKVGDIQRKREGRAVEYRVVDSDRRAGPGQAFADGQNMLLIGGVAFLLGVETEYAEVSRRARRRGQQKRQQGESQRIGEFAAHMGGLIAQARAAQGIGLHLRRERKAGQTGIDGSADWIIVHQDPTFPTPA